MMRVKGWKIDNFGVLNDYSVYGLPSGISVFLGPNESGKSTLLAYICGMLFGFSGLHGKRKLKNLYPALHEGRHGGQLSLGTGEGEYILDRSVQNPTSFTLTKPDGSMGTEEDLKQVLGSMDREVYEAVFAFSLDELAALKSLTSKGVGDKIFSASLGKAGQLARSLIDKLTCQAEALMNADAPATEIRQRLDEVNEIHEQYRQAEAEAIAYPELLEKEDACRLERGKLDEELESQTRAERTALCLIDSWIDWEPMLQVKAELDALSEVGDFVESPEERLQQAENELQGAGDRNDCLHAELESLEVEWDNLRSLRDDTLIEMADAAENLKGFEEYQERCRIHASVSGLIVSMNESLSRFFERTGSGWDANKLSTFDVHEEIRSDVQPWQKRFDTVQEALKEGERNLTQSRLRRAEAQEEQNTAHEALKQAMASRVLKLAKREKDLMEQDTLLEQRDAAAAQVKMHEHRIKVHENRFENALDSLGSCPFRWSAPSFLATSVCFLEIAIWQLLSGAHMLGFFVLGFSALVSAAALKVNRMRARHADRLEKADNIRFSLDREGLAMDDALALQEQLQKQCARHAHQLASNTDFGEKTYQKKLIASEQLDKKLIAVQNDEVRAEVALKSAEKTQSMISESWDIWVKHHGLKGPLTPGQLLGVLDGIDDARHMLDTMESQEQFLADLEAKMEIWASPARKILAHCGRFPDEELYEDRLVRAFEELLVAVAEEKLRGERMAELEPHIKEAREAHKAAKQGFALAEDRLKALFEEAGVDDLEAFEEKLKLYQARRELVERIDAVRSRIGQRFGDDVDQETFWKELDKGDTEAWHEAAGQAREACNEAQARRDKVVGDLREAERARQELETSVDLQNLALHLEELKTELLRKIHEWRIMVVERYLVERALENYLETCQPAVLKAAASFLDEATDGRYTGIRLKEDGKTLAVSDSAGAEKKVEQLSLGTAELLYLCIRFGLVSAFGTSNACLPMVMDDVLVNFDPGRASAVARLLSKISAQNQVFFFTCHPQTVTLLEEACPDVHVEHLRRKSTDTGSIDVGHDARSDAAKVRTDLPEDKP